LPHPAGRVRSDGEIGSESSLLKLSAAETRMRIYELSTDLAGMHGQLYGSYEMTRPDGLHLGFDDEEISRGLLHTRSESIAGGTSEIMRTILGERVLGLPAEPRIDKDRPWSEVPR
jgi:alkylation response protein AidB-like acyl-CoA dehydrogenase